MGQEVKKIKGKIVFKHETAADWEVSNYVPSEGEKILYDPDDSYSYTRTKFGDGKTLVKYLPFSPGLATEQQNGLFSSEDKISLEQLKSINIEKGGMNTAVDTAVDIAHNDIGGTMSDYTLSTGGNNVVGLKGWYYQGINPVNTSIINVYLSKTQTDYPTWGGTTGDSIEELNPYEILGENTIVSLVNDSKYDNKFKIVKGRAGMVQLKAIDENGNAIAVPFSDIVSENNRAPEDYSIYCLSKPDKGYSDLGKYSFSGGYNNQAINVMTTTFGTSNIAYGKLAFVAGKNNEGGYNTTTFGSNNKNKCDNAFVAGTNIDNTGNNSFVTGNKNVNRGKRAHIEGNNNQNLSSGMNNHLEGEDNIATDAASNAHAEGYKTQVLEFASHSEGSETIALSRNTHVEGSNTLAGSKAYYWDAIDFINNKVYLSNEQTAEIQTIQNDPDNFAFVEIDYDNNTTNGYIYSEYLELDEAPNIYFGPPFYLSSENNSTLLSFKVLQNCLIKVNATDINDFEGIWDATEHIFDCICGDFKYFIDVESINEGIDSAEFTFIAKAGSFIDFYGNAANVAISVGVPNHNLLDTSFTAPDWAVGDEISLVNNNKYDACAKITAINHNEITLDKLPFTEIYALATLPFDEYTILNITQPTKGIIDFGRYSHAEGNSTQAINYDSHAEGYNTKAYGRASHTEGFKTEAVYCAHAEGKQTRAFGLHSHTEGYLTEAKSSCAHAEGRETIASAYAAHAEGHSTQANGESSHAEGQTTFAEGKGSHAEGSFDKSVVDDNGEIIYNTAKGEGAHVEGRSNLALQDSTHAEGKATTADGANAHAEGYKTKALNTNTHAEGRETTAEGYAAHAEGHTTHAKGEGSHTEGKETYAQGFTAHAEGYQTKAYGTAGHAEGNATFAGSYNYDITNTDGKTVAYTANTIVNYTHAEGTGTKALGTGAHSEGGSTIAIGNYSHTEGQNTKAYANQAHAEGYNTTAKGGASHAEGGYTLASSNYSHAEGESTTASGRASHAGGKGTIASAEAQTAIGKYNKENADALFIVGNGKNNTV